MRIGKYDSIFSVPVISMLAMVLGPRFTMGEAMRLLHPRT